MAQESGGLGLREMISPSAVVSRQKYVRGFLFLSFAVCDREREESDDGLTLAERWSDVHSYDMDLMVRQPTYEQSIEFAQIWPSLLSTVFALSMPVSRYLLTCFVVPLPAQGFVLFEHQKPKACRVVHVRHAHV